MLTPLLQPADRTPGHRTGTDGTFPRATDPEEGGALGVAILDTFRSSGAFTLASTHLLAIKVYGAIQTAC
jgi:hypothetical protein